MVKCLPKFEYFTVFMKNRNFISKIRRSKVTDYAALNAHAHVFGRVRAINSLSLHLDPHFVYARSSTMR